MKLNQSTLILAAFLFINAMTLCLWAQDRAEVDQLSQVLLQLGEAYDVEVVGDYAYLAASHSGLVIFDISDPDHPEVISSYENNSESTNALAVVDDLAYLADRWGGLIIVDVTNPRQPTFVGAIDTPGDAKGVWVEGNYAYVADGRDSGVVIIDVSDPEEPELVSAYDTPGDAYKVTVSGEILYVADGRAGLLMLDISNPRQPQMLSLYNTPGYVYDLVLVQTDMYIADGSRGFKIIDVEDAEIPELVSELPTNVNARSLVVGGNYVYLADREGGLFILETANRRNPQEVSSLELPGQAHGIALQGDQIFLACYRDGLHVVEIQNRERPQELGSFSSPGYWARNSVLAGGLCYLADSEAGVVIFDVSDSTAPDSLQTFDTPGLVYDVEVAGDYAYLADGAEGIRIFDVSDPQDPQEISSVPASFAMCVEKSGDYLFTADGRNGGLRVTDVSNPAEPVFIRSIVTEGDGNWLAIEHEILCLADGSQGLLVFDLSNPENPEYLATFETEQGAEAVDLAGDLALVALSEGDVLALDLSNPANPRALDQLPLPGFCSGITIERQFAYLGSAQNGLFVIDFTDPGQLELAGFYDTPGYAYTPTVSNGTIFLGDGTNFGIYQFAAGAAPLPDALFINEVMPENQHVIRAPEGDYEPWIELYNANESDLNLSGLTLTTDPDEPEMWTFPEGTQIEPEGFLLVWADGDDGEGLHADLELPAEAGVVFLMGREQNEFVILSSAEYQDLPEDQSWARLVDGGEEWQVTYATTPGYSNTEQGTRALRVELVEGWSMISINVIPEGDYWEVEAGPSVIRMLEQLRIDEQNHRVRLIKDGIGRFYAPEWGFCNIAWWDLTRGYIIQMDEASEAIWTGTMIPPDADIPMHLGWDLWAYYPTYELSAAAPNFTVLSPIIDAVSIAKDDLGRFMTPAWNFSNMPPWRETKGYQIKLSEDEVTLNYPLPEENERAPEPDQRSVQPDCHWSSPTPTAQNMSVLIKLSNFTHQPHDQLAALDNDGLIVGVAEVNEAGWAGLAVWGDDSGTEVLEGLRSGESFTLSYWDEQSRQESTLIVTEILAGGGLSYEPDGFVVLEAGLEPVTAPDQYYLAAAYPNPFNSTTRITFGVPELALVSLTVCDLQGRNVVQLRQGMLTGGTHTCLWEASDVASGIYLIVLKSGDFYAAQKVLLVR